MQENNIIAVFGGAFNPPLNSHLLLAKQIVNEIQGIEKLIFMPVSTNYNKKDLETNEHRYNMLKSLCKENEKFDVSRIELNASRQLFAIETLELVQARYPNKRIYFILGTDNLKLLSQWHKTYDLVQKFNFIVLERKQDIAEDIIKSNKFLADNFKNYIKIRNLETSNFSSTLIRTMLKQDEDVSGLMPNYIYEYIKENNLYMKGDKE